MLGSFSILRAPRHVLFGRGSVRALGRLAVEHGRRVLVCTDGHIAMTPILGSAVDALEASGAKVEVFDRGLPDLPVGLLDEALEVATAARPDVVVGLGGGSSLDLAKLTALLLRYPSPVDRYYGEDRVPGPAMPVLAVPTTAGTGSEVTPVAVVSDPSRALKVGVSSRHLVPLGCICDPSLTDGCPADVTAHAGIDALAHAIEAFTAVQRDVEPPDELAFSRVFVGKNPLSDTFALAAIEHIGRSLVAAVRDGGDERARDGMAYGSLLAGFAFAAAGTSAAHALQYPLGARTSTPHGLGIGLLLPYAMEFNRPARTTELAAVATALEPAAHELPAEAAARTAVDRVAEICATIGIPANLRDLNVDVADLPWMSDQASTITRLVENNPRPLDRAALLQLLEAAW